MLARRPRGRRGPGSLRRRARASGFLWRRGEGPPVTVSHWPGPRPRSYFLPPPPVSYSLFSLFYTLTCIYTRAPPFIFFYYHYYSIRCVHLPNFLFFSLSLSLSVCLSFPFPFPRDRYNNNNNNSMYYNICIRTCTPTPAQCEHLLIIR